MPARPYRPSGQADTGSTPVLLGACLVAGAAVGIAESVVGQWFHLLVLFPVVAGLAVGAVGAWTVGRRRIRAPVAAALLAAAGGLTTQLAYHATDYVRFRADVEREEAARGRAIDLDRALEESTGARGFAGFLLLRARQGTTIKRGSGSGVRVTGAWTFLLWGVEALLALGIAGSMAYARAGEPFCEKCRAWYGADQLVAVGSPEDAPVRQVLAALDARDPPRAVAALGAPGEDARSVLLLRRCPRGEEHEPLLSLQVVTRLRKKPQAKLRYRTLLGPAEAAALAGALATAGAARPA